MNIPILTLVRFQCNQFYARYVRYTKTTWPEWVPCKEMFALMLQFKLTTKCNITHYCHDFRDSNALSFRHWFDQIEMLSCFDDLYTEKSCQTLRLSHRVNDMNFVWIDADQPRALFLVNDHRWKHVMTLKHHIHHNTLIVSTHIEDVCVCACSICPSCVSYFQFAH